MPSTPPPGEPPEAANEASASSALDAPTTETPAAAAPAAEAPAVGAPSSAAPPAGPQQQFGPPPGFPPPGPVPPPYGGWAPVPRPPRVPWVNPDRRVHLAGAAIIAGLVLLAGGFGIGWAASSGDDHHRDLRGHFGNLRGPDMMRGGYPGMQIPRGQLPQRQFPNPGQPAAPATPSPTSTK